MSAGEETEVTDAAILEDESAPTDLRYQVSSYGADYPVDGLVKRLSKRDIILPDFQRDFVWSLEKASRFIESLLLGLPTPAIFLSKVTETQEFLVIDGQQRLRSLQYFCEGRLRGKDFSLKGVNRQFDGKTYKTLGESDRRRLDDALIHAIIIRQEDPKDDDGSIVQVFERINTTSTPLSEHEIRSCVYKGAFSQYLGTANTNSAWREIYGDVNDRQKDRELLLRFFSLYFSLDSYERPMKLFLTNFMRKNKDLQIYGEPTLNGIFIPTVTLACSALGRDAFRPTRSLNASVTDAILVGTAKRLAKGKIEDTEEYKNKILDVLNSADFKELYSNSTTNKDNIEKRINMVLEAITGVR